MDRIPKEVKHANDREHDLGHAPVTRNAIDRNRIHPLARLLTSKSCKLVSKPERNAP